MSVSRGSLSEIARRNLAMWDNDGTFYPYSQAIYDNCDSAVADLALEHHIVQDMQLTHNEIFAMAKQSYHEHGSSFAFLTREPFGLDYETLHHAYHDRLQVELIDPDPHLPEVMKALPIRSVVVSHGSESWVQRSHAHMGIADAFSPASIFSHERLGFKNKHVSAEAIRQVLHESCVDPREAILVEDSSANLRPAHEIGVMTVLITHGKGFAPKEHPHVDWVFPTGAAFAQAVVLAGHLSGTRPARTTMHHTPRVLHSYSA